MDHIGGVFSASGIQNVGPTGIGFFEELINEIAIYVSVSSLWVWLDDHLRAKDKNYLTGYRFSG